MTISKIIYLGIGIKKETLQSVDDIDVSEHYDSASEMELWVEVTDEVVKTLEENDYLKEEEVLKIKEEEVDTIIFY